MVCYFVQKFCRNSIWLARRVSRGAARPVTLEHKPLVERAPSNMVEPRTCSWTIARPRSRGAIGPRRRAISGAGARARREFPKFFSKFFEARRVDESRAPSTCDVAQEAQSHHDGYIAESLEKKGLKLHSLLKLSALARRSKVYSSSSDYRYHEIRLIGFYLIFKKKDHFLQSSSSKC
jgi:hypothetical protein